MDTSTSHSVFKQFHQHDFEADQRFQNGLKALGASSNGTSGGDDPLSINIVDSLETRHFYWTKFYSQFDLIQYKNWVLAEDPVPSSLQPTPPAHKEKSLSFQEIMELVQKGEEVPGIKQIPDLVLTLSSEASKPKLEPIKKPWEK